MDAVACAAQVGAMYDAITRNIPRDEQEAWLDRHLGAIPPGDMWRCLDVWRKYGKIRLSNPDQHPEFPEVRDAFVAIGIMPEPQRTPTGERDPWSAIDSFLRWCEKRPEASPDPDNERYLLTVARKRIDDRLAVIGAGE